MLKYFSKKYQQIRNQINEDKETIKMNKNGPSLIEFYLFLRPKTIKQFRELHRERKELENKINMVGWELDYLESRIID